MEGKEQCVLRTHPIRNKRDRGGVRGEAAAGGSLCLRIGRAIASRSFLLFNKCVSLLSDIHRPSKPKAREGRQVNEGKSRVRGSEEIPNANEGLIRFLSGL